MIPSAYLAGFIDGDGSISIAKSGNYYALRIEISQHPKHEEIIRKIHREWGGYRYKRTGGYGNNPLMMVSWTGQNARPLLKEVLPFLVLKKKQAKLALQFVDKMPGRLGRGHKQPAWMATAYKRMKGYNL